MNYQRYYARDGTCVICEKQNNEFTLSRPRIYRFPFDPDRCRVWVKVAGIKSLVYLPLEDLHRHKFLCYKHFSPLCFNSKQALHKVAIPSQNLPFEPLSDKSLAGFPHKKLEKPKKKHNIVQKSLANMNVETSCDEDVPLNCIETNMNTAETGEPMGTQNDKTEAAPKVVSNVKCLYIGEVQKKTKSALPTPLMKCTKTVFKRSGRKVYDPPLPIVPKPKKYGKCYSRATSRNKIIKQNNIIESTNGESSQIPSMNYESAVAENTFDVPVTTEEITNEVHELPQTDELIVPHSAYDGTSDFNELPEPSTPYNTPLMNCTDTIFKYGQIHFGTGSNEVLTIDVPLMHYFKSIEDM